MKIIKWPIIYIVVQFLLMFIFAFIYILLGNAPNLFSEFMVNNKIYLTLILGVIFIPLLIKNYKNAYKENNNKINLLLLLLIGFTFSIIYNVLAFYLNKYVNTNLYNTSSNILVTIISTVLVGPIIEELMFRGIMYKEAKEKYSNMKAILLTTTIFAIMHFNIFQMIYAFAFGFMLIYVYEKYKTIKAPIIMHMVSNLTTTLFVPFLIKDYFIINYILFIICLIILYLTKKKTNDFKEW